MNFVANYEVRSTCSIVDDEKILKIRHPKGRYRARVQNIQRTVYTVPFLLSINLYFDALSLHEAQDVADDCLADCLNMLVFATGASFKRHRIRQIVDASQNKGGMRDVLMWSDSIEYEDPQPFITEDHANSIEKLLEFDIPSAIRRAMRWYRLGVNATVPDDQFMNFWFALEIIAEFQKSPEKVHDKCPKCRSPLYCESCKSHPTHKPFAKQAIRTLLKAIEKDCDDGLITRLEKTRNSLMHGLTLKEIEDSLPQPHEQIVDILGRLIWKALIHQFPKELFNGNLAMGYPSTYISRKVNAVISMKTIVPQTPEGDFILNFSGFKAEAVPFGPPQSATPSIIKMNIEQYERLRKISFSKGDHQEMCKRIAQQAEQHGGTVRVLILATDMKAIQEALKKGEQGLWQDLFRELIKG